MNTTKIPGVYKKGPKLFTINPPNCKGIKVYGEQLRTFKGNEYRSWNPYRSKLAAAISKKFESIALSPSSNILYLGAATGTTVSHLSDICSDGIIYAVEPSPVAAKSLLQLVEQRPNIIPIIEDANHPERYDHIVSKVDMIYQDISQRNQSEIFINNQNQYLTSKGTGILMVKARSIDVALKPAKAYETVEEQLSKAQLHIEKRIDLSPYEKDHAAIFVSQIQGR